MWGPASNACFAVVWHGLAQTAFLEGVPSINVDLALRGAALVLAVVASTPGIVFPGVRSLASGWAVISVT